MRVAALAAAVALSASAIAAPRVDRDSVCAQTATVAEAVAQARDEGVAQVRVMELVLRATDPDQRAWGVREVDWAYANPLIGPTIAKQLRFAACASRLARGSS